MRQILTPEQLEQVKERMRGRGMTEEQIETAAKMLPYFDAVNFARKITVPVLLTMGFLDTTCPPSGVYSAYNVIASPKQIVTNPNAGHATPAASQAAIQPWARGHLGLVGPPPAPEQQGAVQQHRAVVC